MRDQMEVNIDNSLKSKLEKKLWLKNNNLDLDYLKTI